MAAASEAIAFRRSFAATAAPPAACLGSDELLTHIDDRREVVAVRYYSVAGDPAKDGKMDYAGVMAGYSQFFGTRDQPKIARSRKVRYWVHAYFNSQISS